MGCCQFTGGCSPCARGGRDVLGMGQRGLRDLRARHISMVYQEPGRALNPSLRVGAQPPQPRTTLGVQPDPR